MEVAVAAVMSLDGKLTRHNKSGVTAWASPEEQKRFLALIAGHDVIVMGSGTYKTVKGSLKLEDRRLRIVLTSQTAKYEAETVPGNLEFYNQTPSELADQLVSRGFKKLLVLGGSRMIYDFLQSELVDKLYITIEPLIFGQGKPLVESLPLRTRLALMKNEILNSQGTCFMTYKVIK